MNIPPGKELAVLLRNGDAQDKARVTENATYLKKLAKLSTIEWLVSDEEAPVAATALVGELEILVPMSDFIDKEAELVRLGKETGKLEQEIARIEGKLGNPSFVDKAPAAVVEKEREKLQGHVQTLAKLREQALHLSKL